MSNPEQSQFVADNPKTAEFIDLAITQGLGDRRKTATWMLDVAEDLETNWLAALEAARLITDGIIPVDDVNMATTTEVITEPEPVGALFTPKRRIPLRIKPFVEIDFSNSDFVPPSQDVLEAEVRKAFSDDFIRATVAGKNEVEDDSFRAHVERAFSPANADPTIEEFDAWREMLSNVTDSAESMRTGLDLDEEINAILGSWDLRKKAIIYIEDQRGKGVVSRTFRVFEEYFSIKQLSDRDFLQITGEVGPILRNTRNAIAKNDFSDVDTSTPIVRNFLRNNGVALRKVKDGWEIVEPSEIGESKS